MDPKSETLQHVRTYLDLNKKRLNFMNVDFIVWDVRTFVPGAAQLPESDLRVAVVVWQSINGPLVPLPIQPPPTSSDSGLIEAAKKAVTTAIDGATLKRGAGMVNLSVTGLTAELQKGSTKLTAGAGWGGPTVGVEKGDFKASAGVSWGGTLGLEAEKGDFHFSGSLSKDRWEIKLSFPQDTAIPDMSTLGKVFGEGEAALFRIIGSTTSFRGLSDVARIKDAVSPQLKPVEDAVEAVKGIAKAPPKGGVSFGFSLSSPDPLPGQTGISPGWQAQATLTIRF